MMLKGTKTDFFPQCLEELKLPSLVFGFCELYNANVGYQISKLYLFLPSSVAWLCIDTSWAGGEWWVTPTAFSWSLISFPDSTNRTSRTSTVLPQCHQSSCSVFNCHHDPISPFSSKRFSKCSTRTFWRIIFGFCSVKSLLNMSTLTD